MAAGKIFLAKAYRKPARRYRKKSGFRKAVTAIAKKAVMTTAETMTGVISHSATFGTNGTFTGGIFQPVGQGTAQNNRVGDEIRSLGIKIRGHVLADPAIIVANIAYTGYRLMVVAGKRPLTSGDMPQFKGAVDPEALTVLYDRYYKFSSTCPANFLNKYIPFKRVIKYTLGVPTRNELYIWMIPAPLGGGITTTTGFSTAIDIQQYWKDI